MTEPAKSPLKHQALLLAVVLAVGGGAMLLLRENPYETPETTFAAAMAAVARSDADGAWDCVDATDRRKVAFLAKRMVALGEGEDPLEALFRQGLERYPDFGDAVLEQVRKHPTDENRAQAWITWGTWQVQLEVFRQDDEWKFDKVSEVILSGPRRRAQQPAAAD